MRRILAILLSFVAACDSTDDASGQSLVFTSTPVTLAAGSESVTCWDFTVDTEYGVTGVHVALPEGTHHYSLSLGAGAAKASPYDCGVIPGGGPNAVTLGIGGPGADGLTFPDGTALAIADGSVMILQLHLLNATTEPLDVAATRIELAGTEDASGLQPVGMLVAATGDISLPPHTTGVQVYGGCTVPQSLDHAFAGYLHAHTRARQLSVDVTASAGQPARILDANPWNFDQQQIYPFEAAIAQGSKLELTCTYDNQSDETIVGGQLASNEMCVGIVYFWPAPAAPVPCFGSM